MELWSNTDSFIFNKAPAIIASGDDMSSKFYTNYSEERFIDKLRKNIDLCNSFYFSVSFIKKAGLKLIAPNIEAALARGAKGKIITSTYQNFTDVDSLTYFYGLQNKYNNQFSCHLDIECFKDLNGNTNGFHSKGYLFEFDDYNELLIGSSNITVYALLKNIEWDVSVIGSSYDEAKKEFNYLWDKTVLLDESLISEYKNKLFYAIERWDMDYSVANASTKTNYMQRKALKELNRIRAMGASKALICSAAGSGKTYLAAFDALNFNPDRLLYVVQEGSILMKSFETFQTIFGSNKSYGIYNKDYKEFDKDFVFSTNVTMANSLELFNPHDFDYIIIDECHHATASTYRKIIEYFEPQFLLGITATPERMDGEDVFELFDQNVPYELRLRDAIMNHLVVPFHYYGIRDELIEYSEKSTKGHKFIEQFSDEKHCDFIYKMIEKHRIPGQKLKALAFCRDISHAIRMSQAMEDYYHTQYLTGKNSIGERIRAYNDLQSDNSDLEILFTVDILNEGVDIPGVNMVLFLRPTDSQTIFIQQLGRGLRNYEGKQYVTVLDFIGNDYKRSVQIAFALGGLSKNFVMEKNLVKDLVVEDFKSIGLSDYGVEIHFDDLSKKEIMAYIDDVNFNTRKYLEQDYKNFKKYIGASDYPKHMDYLNNDYAPDLLKFMQSKISGTKNYSYYGFLKNINEDNLPVFNTRQEEFIKYLSDMLPIVRDYEYLIVQEVIEHAGNIKIKELENIIKQKTKYYSQESFDHAIQYMIESDYFKCINNVFSLNDIDLNIELEQYLEDLIQYGLSRYEIEFSDLEENQTFKLWASYKKTQIKQLLLKNPKDYMKGTDIYDGVVYIYVTIHKGNTVKENLNYDDGYIDSKTFQWETVSNISQKELMAIKMSKCVHIFVKKTKEENGIVLPFTYIGKGKMTFIENSLKPNGAYLFHVDMEHEADDDVYFDFKLRR